MLLIPVMSSHVLTALVFSLLLHFWTLQVYFYFMDSSAVHVEEVCFILQNISECLSWVGSQFIYFVIFWNSFFK